MSIDVMKQALVVLEEIADEVFAPYDNKLGDAILALRAAIEQAPWVKTYAGGKPNYTAPRQWQGLTDDDIAQAMYRADAIITGPMQFNFAREIEAKLKEKNT
jgi:hypothetical protein